MYFSIDTMIGAIDFLKIDIHQDFCKRESVSGDILK